MFEVFIIFAVVGISVAGLYYTLQKDEESKKNSWRTLATSKGLKFISRNPLKGGTRVVGNYQGYRLCLDTYQNQKTVQTCTRIVLSTNNEFPNPRTEDVQEKLVPRDVLDLFNSSEWQRLSGKIGVEVSGQKIYYEQPGIEDDIQYLRDVLELLRKVIDVFPKVLTLGGEAIPSLEAIAVQQRHPLQQVAGQLICEIAQETLQLSNQASRLICSRCLVHCASHKVQFSEWETTIYYGCRACSQSKEFFEFNGRTLVVLDSQAEEFIQRQDNLLKANWLVCRTLFDFNEVQIINTIDEDVERFAVQVGNDTDTVRKAAYKDMVCMVSSKCDLSENTMRILCHTFGQVKVSDF